LPTVSFRAARLGLGDWLIGIGSVALLVDLFAVTWFSYKPEYRATAVMLGQRVSATGWQTFEVVGPLALVVCLVGTAIWWLAATRRSPALPVVLTTLLAPVALALAVLLAIRVLLDRPSVHLLQAGGANVVQARPGAYAALALSIVIFAGLYLSLRREAVAPDDSPAMIEVLSLDRPRPPAAT
jgi:hypothetical protein